MEKFPIVYICDEGYSIPTIVSITSLLKNRKKGIFYKIYILTSYLPESIENDFKRIEMLYEDVEIKIIKLCVKKYDSIYKKYDGNTGAGSIIALLKFDIANVIREKKVLYLDGDTIVRKDISELFYMDIENYVAGVIKDSAKIYNKNGLRGKLPKYFNSGVMLLNLDYFRNNNYFEKLIDAKQKQSNINLVDQDAFNIAFRGHTKLLPVKYNALLINLVNSINLFNMNEFNAFYDTHYSCFYDLNEDVSILHFASKLKPWIYCDTPYADEWLKYYQYYPFNKMLQRKNFNSKSKLIINNEIPIILATDENYLPQTSITIISVLENNPKYYFNFYILIPNKFDEQTERKFFLIKKLYKNCKIDFIEMKDAFNDVKLNIPHITSPTFYRLMASSLFPKYNKIIYLDSDVIVEGDIAKYYSIDLNGYYVAGVKAPSYHAAPDGNKKYCKNNGLPAIDQYINAGVIIMNLEELRKNNMEDLFIELSKKGYRSQDQDVINGACYGHIKHLHYKYNCMITKYENERKQLKKVFTTEEINEANNMPVIIHYAAEEKPWKDIYCALADRWWRYAFISPFYFDIIEKFEKNIIKNVKEYRILSQNLKNKEISKLKRELNSNNLQKVDKYTFHYLNKKLINGIKCYKEHGLKYTLFRILDKIKN